MFLQNKKLFAGFLCLFVLMAHGLFAFSIGRQGEPYWEDGVQWQKVYMETDAAKATASLPYEGTCRSLLSGGWCHAYSVYKGGIYDLKTAPGGFGVKPGEMTLPQMVEWFQKAFDKNDIVYPIEASIPGVCHVIEVHVHNSGNKTPDWITRAHCTSDAIFFVEIQDQEYSLAERVFATFSVE